MIKTITNIFTVLVMFLMFALWSLWTFLPERAKALFEVDAVSATGINALKSDMGGAVLTVGLLILLGFVHKKQWFYAAAIASGSILISRVISLAVDGFSQAGIAATILEVLAIIAFLFLASSSRNSRTGETL